MAGKFETVVKGVYLVGGDDLTDPNDALIYLVQGPKTALIDCGCGKSVNQLLENVNEAGINPAKIKYLILTHAHVDHIGGAAELKRRLGLEIVAHTKDAQFIQTADPTFTAADWYKVTLEPVKVDRQILNEEESIGDLTIISIPGHTPGSIAVTVKREDKIVLFGQDIHGPFDVAFHSDLTDWRLSMLRLLSINADILCEGHFGIFHGKDRVKKFIKRYLDFYAESL